MRWAVSLLELDWVPSEEKHHFVLFSGPLVPKTTSSDPGLQQWNLVIGTHLGKVVKLNIKDCSLLHFDNTSDSLI